MTTPPKIGVPMNIGTAPDSNAPPEASTPSVHIPEAGLATASPITSMSSADYSDLLAALRTDLQLDLSIDTLPHTGNDVPDAYATGGGAWQPLSPYYNTGWATYPSATSQPPTAGLPYYVPQMFVDANGWVQMRGLMEPTANWSYGTIAQATLLNLPSSVSPSGALTELIPSYDGGYGINITLVLPKSSQALNGYPGNVIMLGGVGTVNGISGGYFDLSNLRWNCKS